MDLDNQLRATLMAAGSSTLKFNAPLGSDRLQTLLAQLGSSRGLVVDLGCGKATLLKNFLGRFPNRVAIGVDNDGATIDAANSDPDLPTALTLLDADVQSWEPPGEEIGAVVAIGVSHIFGGPAEMFDKLGEMCPHGIAVVGDGIWQSEPDPWCRTTFGDLPRGPEGAASLAQAAGWTVTALDSSSLDEWDDFERGWTNGVRAVGIPEATSFADQRAAEYQRYRGVLGFAWLGLTR